MEIPMPSRGYKFVTCPTDLCKTQKKKPQPFLVGVSEIKAWQCPTFTWGNPTLSSALSSFTSEFGKGSGGSHSLWPPGRPFTLRRVNAATDVRAVYVSKKRGDVTLA